MNIPTIAQIKNLHRRYAKSDAAFQLVFTHCEIVWELSRQLIKNNDLVVNDHFIRAACLLHDIGAYLLIDEAGNIDERNYIKHGPIGYVLLKSENFPEQLCRIAERHTGVGISKNEVKKKKLPLPLRDYIAETPEERLIMYADKYHSKTPFFNSFEWYNNYIKKLGENKVRMFKKLADEFGVPDINVLSKKYHTAIR